MLWKIIHEKLTAMITFGTLPSLANTSRRPTVSSFPTTSSNFLGRYFSTLWRKNGTKKSWKYWKSKSNVNFHSHWMIKKIGYFKHDIESDYLPRKLIASFLRSFTWWLTCLWSPRRCRRFTLSWSIHFHRLHFDSRVVGLCAVRVIFSEIKGSYYYIFVKRK